MLFKKIQKIIIVAGMCSFLLFWIGGGLLVFASEQSAQQQKDAELKRIEAEWQKYQDQIDVKYSSRIERSRDRLYELRLELEEDLKKFDKSQKETNDSEDTLHVLESRLTTLQGQLENVSRSLKTAEEKVASTEEQIAIKEADLAKVLEEKQEISAEADLQRGIVLDYFTLLQTESESLEPVPPSGARILLSSDSFSKNLRDEMHFTALEKTARQVFHDLEGAMTQLEEVDYLLSEERDGLKKLHNRLEIERNTIAQQRSFQKEIFESTLGEEQRFQDLFEESRQQMAESANRIAEIKSDMDYIHEQLNLLETNKQSDQRTASKENIRHLLETEDKTYDIGDLFLLQDQEDAPLSWPVDPEKITAYFQDEHYQEVFGVEHNAVDIRAPQETEIHAPAAGYVYKVMDEGTGYWYLMLIHKNNLMTVYGHLSKFAVKEGDLVQEGDILGYTGGAIGTPGAGLMTTGPHLHFEVWENSVVQDPLNYLPLGELPPEEVPKKYLWKGGEENKE